MRRGLWVFGVAMAAAGVATALMLAPAVPAPSRPAQVAAKSDPAAGPAAAKSVLEARQAPVPVLMRARTPVELPAFDADARGTDTAAKAVDEGGEGSAKAAVEADGYKGVKVLRKGANGLWYAEAMRGNTKVLLTVDAQGNVAAE